MKRILIAYANENMKYSLKQLGIQARYIKQIDKVILYTEKDLSQEILQSPLMKYRRGGGYWVWKPYLIWKTLQDYPEGTKICYIDAGCTIYPGDEWEKYWKQLDLSDIILFQYANHIPRWESVFGCSSSSIECWTKKKTLDYYDTYLATQEYHSFSKIWGGLVFCKGKDNSFIKEWLEITLHYPELITDPDEEELKTQHTAFNGNHRHDQSIITPLAFKYQNKGLTILQEIFDENKQSKIIITSRNRVTKQMYMKVFFKFHLQGILGINRYNKIKQLLNVRF
jgi:hypothetical protein